MLQAATRRAQRALLSRLAFQRGAATEAPLSPPTSAAPTSTLPRYSPPKTGNPSPSQVPIPTRNFWESTRPSEWKISHQYWFLGGVGALAAWATVKALSGDNNGEGGHGGGDRDNEAGEKSKVTGEMSPAKRAMVVEQERSPVKKQVP